MTPGFPTALLPDGAPRTPDGLQALRGAVRRQVTILSAGGTYPALVGPTAFPMLAVVLLPERALPPRIQLAEPRSGSWRGARIADEAGRPALEDAVGLQATLLLLRPDPREAEARLHAAEAEIGVAVAEFHPDIDLIGALNAQSLRLSDLFALPSRAFDVGAGITFPLFEGGRLRGNLALREARRREAAIAFRRTGPKGRPHSRADGLGPPILVGPSGDRKAPCLVRSAR